MTTQPAHAIRWGIFLVVLWGAYLLFSFSPSHAAAHQRGTPVVVLENTGAGKTPERAVRRLGGRVDRQIPLIRGFTARLRRGTARALRAAPGVRSVRADRRFVLRSTTDVNAPSTTLDTLRAIIGADGVTGGAADVAIIDSGVSATGSLAGRVVDGPDLSEDAPVDELRHLDAFGHGTHLAGIVAAVAPQSRVVNVKVADHDGATSLGRLLAGIDWVVRNGDRDGLDVRVLNLAFGAETEGSYRDDPLAYAVERAWQKGLVVVASAGNGGDAADGLDSPAHDPYVLAVGAEDSGGTLTPDDDSVAPFSSRGSASRSPDLIAPGTAIVSTRVPGSFLDEAFPAARIGESGFRGSGTSQAAAVVSGAAALLVGARPDLDPDDVKTMLRATARPVRGTDVTLQGAGALDVAAAAGAATSGERQRFPRARLGGWLRGTPSHAFAIEDKGSRWTGSRWTGSRWTGSRWTGSRWTGSRWTGSRWTGSRWTGSRWTGSRWTSIDATVGA